MMNRYSGFTLIEMLVAMAIISILSTIGLSAFQIYKKEAHYSRAVSDIGNAKIAVEVGTLDHPEGIALNGWTGHAGGPVPVNFRQAMPAATTSPDVQLGVILTPCNGENFAPKAILISQPCKGEKFIRYTKFCNGVELNEPKIRGAINCN
ncbi:MAG: prepilin-type N-terminal cleavage/methylation domain-containing protein [Deltaproteobacteria bacterium]|nr:prepilin-type N-terminal cleavage/methylation domain-containing protein [Deltaproteobacteria bacterium]